MTSSFDDEQKPTGAPMPAGKAMPAGNVSVEQNNNQTEKRDFNTSGQGSNAFVPDVVAKRFNWGACLLNWIWGLGNKTYITLLIFIAGFIPFIGILVVFGMQIWFGIKGNAWAWQNKRFQNIEHFHSYQKKWAIAGIIWYCLTVPLAIIGIIAALTLPTLMTNTVEQQYDVMAKKAKSTAYEVVLMNEALEEKCDLSSEGLAACFAKQMNVSNIDGNIINAKDMTTWEFDGDGVCAEEGDCSVTVSSNDKEVINIPLSVNEKGYIYVNKEELD